MYATPTQQAKWYTKPMKQIALIGSKASFIDDVQEMRGLQTFMHEVLGDAASTSLVHLDQLVFVLDPSGVTVHDTANGMLLADYDAVFLRGPKMRPLSELAYCVSRSCVLGGIPFCNDYSMYYRGSKVAQTFVFYELGAPFLKTVYAADNHLLLSAAKKELGFPFILKDNVGSHGDSNYLVRSEEEAHRILLQDADVDFLAQAYCPNDRDYRLLLMGGKQLVFERRGGADTHLNNTSKGADVTPVHNVLPAEIIAKAREVSEHLGLMISGVDVMPRLDTGKLYFLEINSQPQLRTGALLEEKKQALREVWGELLH